MDALVSSYTNLGRKMSKNDAAITRTKDDATVKLILLINIENNPDAVSLDTIYETKRNQPPPQYPAKYGLIQNSKCHKGYGVNGSSIKISDGDGIGGIIVEFI